MIVRGALPDDAPAIAAIYNEGIEDRVATFETRLRTIDEIRAVILSLSDKSPSAFSGKHPIVVVEEQQEVIAYASTSSYRERECYAGVAECSVYVRRDRRGRGAGRVVLEALIEEAERAGFWKLLSRIFVDNQASRTLVRACGFREVGIYEKHGKLDGVWRDVVIVERLLPSNLQ